MSQMAYGKVELELEKIKLSERELLVVSEIGSDMIDSASKFVDYMSDVFGFSKSSVWYTLNRLKERGILDFASRFEVGKPLVLTDEGRARLSTAPQERHGGPSHSYAEMHAQMHAQISIRRR